MLHLKTDLWTSLFLTAWFTLPVVLGLGILLFQVFLKKEWLARKNGLYMLMLAQAAATVAPALFAYQEVISWRHDDKGIAEMDVAIGVVNAFKPWLMDFYTKNGKCPSTARGDLQDARAGYLWPIAKIEALGSFPSCKVKVTMAKEGLEPENGGKAVWIQMYDGGFICNSDAGKFQAYRCSGL